MSKISLSPDANGTGIFTIASPGTNTNRTLTLPDDTGTIVTNSGNQAGSFTTLNTSGAVVFNDAGADVDFRVEGDTDANLLFVDASTDRVGIGTSSPQNKFTVSGATPYVSVFNTTAGSGAAPSFCGIRFYGFAENANGLGCAIEAGNEQTNNLSGTLRFLTSPTGGTPAERMRIDSSGNLLVGNTTVGVSDVGCELRANGLGAFTTSDATALEVNRLVSDGTLVNFRKDSTVVGSIVSRVGVGLAINSQSSDGSLARGGTELYYWGANEFYPATDNARDLGKIALRWDDVYATNGTIQTSDANEKQDIEALSEAETRVAIAAKGLLKKYRWKSAVAEKGDDARIHFGIIAQDLKAAFEAEGLDAGRYAMFIHSAWWEHEVEVPAVEAQEVVLDDEGNVVQEAVEGKEAYTRTDTYETEAEAPEGAVRKERMGIRYNELLAFIIAAI